MLWNALNDNDLCTKCDSGTVIKVNGNNTILQIFLYRYNISDNIKKKKKTKPQHKHDIDSNK